jgi:His-Xaa-Ser system radical SAM maturase HxsB
MPFQTRRLPSGSLVAVSSSSDFAFLEEEELKLLQRNPESLPLTRQADLKSRFFLRSAESQPGLQTLLHSRRRARRETVSLGPSLHIIVPTLQCAHTCQYCQVSRSLESDGFSMTERDLDAACDSVFESPAPNLTVEFQGGDPLLRFDLVERAITRIAKQNSVSKRRVRFVVASTLHQLDAPMCGFLKEHEVYLSTSIDGPEWLHNRNRPLPSRDAYERTTRGIELARRLIGPNSVSALMTTTRASLDHAADIVDTYVELGLNDLFVRPLSVYGFAKRNASLGYGIPEFMRFYADAIERVLHWNRADVPLREFYGSIILNKLLSTFDMGFVDLQSPSGAGRSVVVYNYDGFVYPSDEARMLAETGDTSLRLGTIGTPLQVLQASSVMADLERHSATETFKTCSDCAYRSLCAPNPVDAQAQFGSMCIEPSVTHHCARHLALFDYWLERIRCAASDDLNLYHRWAQPTPEAECDAS